MGQKYYSQSQRNNGPCPPDAKKLGSEGVKAFMWQIEDVT
jgi:hypothetical protein